MKIQRRDKTHVETDSMDYKELEQLRNEVHLIVIDIEGQLDLAKAKKISDGEYASPEWFARANSALRANKFNLQRLQEILSAKKKEEKGRDKDREISSYFVDIAKEQLDRETFTHLLTLAKERKNNDQ